MIYGTFDLFHLGHKNILDGAKKIAHERNLKLIVGVTSNEFDIQRGKTNVHDSVDIRINNVRNWCKPDEIIIEKHIGQKIDDIKKYEGRVIVFGSDWDGKMDYLKNYCEVVYLPRTEGISSTTLRMKKNKKNAIVIGGSSDIGMGVINMLLKRGYSVISTYHSTIPEGEINGLKWVNVDLSNNGSVLSFCNMIKNEVEVVDILVYNASRIKRKSFLDINDEDIEEIMNINVISCYKIIRELYDIFSNGSKIMVTGSHMGTIPHSVAPIYGMSKSCLHSMVKNMVKVVENKKMTINAIVPGFVETKLQKDKPKEIRENICKKTALHRFATVDEIVKGFIFCLDNDFVNGSLIEINGGYCYE